MDWIIAAGLTIILAVALPTAIVAAKKTLRGNRRMVGVALSIGLARPNIAIQLRCNFRPRLDLTPSNGLVRIVRTG